MKDRFRSLFYKWTASICHLNRLAVADEEPKTQLSFKLKDLLA
jgi:hypothetical protein